MRRHKMKKRFLLVLSFCLIAAMLVAGTTSAAPVKVDVCHIDDLGNFIKINISENAFDAHLAHGDASPNENVPGMSNYKFNGECVPYGYDTVEVNAFGDEASSTLVTKLGANYELVATGTYKFANWGEYGIADAKFNYRDAAHGGPGWVNGADFASPHEYALQVNFFGSGGLPLSPISWQGDYNLDHTYTAEVIGTGTTFSFMIWDNYTGDNSGFITVTITELP